MELDRCISTRRSTHKFLDKKISWNKICDILESARYAPSSGNIQNWRFVIVQDPKKIKKISQYCSDQVWIATAPTLIVVCNDESEVKRMYKKRSTLFSIQNCAAAIQNILLKSNSMNIDSCWIGIYNADKIKDMLRIPPEIKIDAIIALGYAEKKEEIPKRIDLENICFFDEWNKKKK